MNKRDGCTMLIMKVKVAQSCLTLCNPMDYTVHGILQARILEWVAFPFSRGSSQPRDGTRVSHIAGRSFTSWTTRKPKNTGVGSLSLLQGIFPTQESNLPCLHTRWLLAQRPSSVLGTWCMTLVSDLLSHWIFSTALWGRVRRWGSWAIQGHSQKLEQDSNPSPLTPGPWLSPELLPK